MKLIYLSIPIFWADGMAFWLVPPRLHHRQRTTSRPFQNKNMPETKILVYNEINENILCEKWLYSIYYIPNTLIVLYSSVELDSSQHD